jgi:parvulin-like peptidyl-prolyl isomerase
MYKIFLILVFVLALNAKPINSVAIVVKGEPITLYDLEEEMRASKVDMKSASATLIRKKLETTELKKRKITVSSAEVYDNIKKTAAANKMSVSDFYETVRNSQGLSTPELKLEVKEKLLSQKLYSSIAYSSIKAPTDSEIKEYYELHKKDFTHPVAFNVVVYTSKNKKLLNKKRKNPMIISSEITNQKKRYIYDQIPLKLAKFLESTEVNRFTPIINSEDKDYVTIYIKDIESSKKIEYKDVKDTIKNIIIGKKREQVLRDYFTRLKNNADIKFIENK